MALLQSMNVKLCRTFGDLAISFVQSQLSCFPSASSIIDVFDRYDVEQSIKSAERDRRSRTARYKGIPGNRGPIYSRLEEVNECDGIQSSIASVYVRFHRTKAWPVVWVDF